MNQRVGTSGRRTGFLVLRLLAVAVALALGFAIAPLSAAIAAARFEEFCLIDPVVYVNVGGKIIELHVDYGIRGDASAIDVAKTDGSVRTRVHVDDGEAEIKVEIIVYTKNGSRVPARMMLSVPAQQVSTDWQPGVSNTHIKQKIKVSAA